MKKFMIAAIAVFAIIGIAVSSLLISASRVSRYLRESDDHRRDVIVNYSKVYAEHFGDVEQTVSLHPYNTVEFMTAVTRSGLLYRYTKPETDGNRIVVNFADGAVYTVIDGGLNKRGKDLVYIIYEYDGRTYCFELSGYRTFERVQHCTGPEGFGTNNWPVDESDQTDDAA